MGFTGEFHLGYPAHMHCITSTGGHLLSLNLHIPFAPKKPRAHNSQQLKRGGGEGSIIAAARAGKNKTDTSKGYNKKRKKRKEKKEKKGKKKAT